ncbi:MAG: baseplate assembly protein [Desulfobacteraceae bacterium]|nr:baseplate assembly protein [Desulfobacteraceae bacterium]
MMEKALSIVDLSKLPSPKILEELNFETIFDSLITDLKLRSPEFTELVESDPAYKILEVAAYREVLLRQRINESAKAVMLAYASGTDLDNLAANFNVERLIINEGNSKSIPPIEPVFESDIELKKRIQLSFAAYSVAGSKSAYVYYALGADPDIKDIGVASPSPGIVVVSVLSRLDDGKADQGLRDIVQAALDDDVRPLTDQVIVQSANIVKYTVEASLRILDGPDTDIVLQNAQNEIQTYVDSAHLIGRPVTKSGIYAALHVSGVQNVHLTAPVDDVLVNNDEAPYCTNTIITVEK